MAAKRRVYKAKKNVPVDLSKEVAVPKTLVMEGEPDEQLIFAHKAASALMAWVEQKPKKVMIRGEQYLEFGDWQILARFYGSTVGVEWTRSITLGSPDGNGVNPPLVRGYEARATVLRNGEVISSAEAMCTRDERNWRDRDEFMLKSMAQTRASAKALRQAFGWVAELAGMKSTPAEEMGEQYDKSPVEDTALVITLDTDTDAPEKTPTELRMQLFEILRSRGVDVKSKFACEEYVAETTQLALVPSNFAAIVELLKSSN